MEVRKEVKRRSKRVEEVKEEAFKKQHRSCGCKWLRWRGREQGQRHQLNKKIQVAKERTNWDLQT